uniref:Uncharacterized protein n=1 Tax=viral metagenome TaxID=1070528 RepID=A0A6M3LS29_9ZZZZ
MLHLEWNTIGLQAREELLCGACINTRFAHYEWEEIDLWLRKLISKSLALRSKRTVVIA